MTHTNIGVKKAVVLILIVVAITMLLCFFIAKKYVANQSSQRDNNKVSIRLKWLHQSQFAGYYYADKAGFYKDKGLNVTLNAGGLDFPSIQMVASGSDQFGVAGADQILLAREKGVPVVGLAVIYQQTPLVIFSLEESGIKKPSDLVGKTVGVKYGQDEELVYRSILRAAGVDEKKIHEVAVKYDLSLLLQKKVDALLGYSTNEPFLIEEQSGKKVNLIYPADYGVRYYADTLFTTEDMVKNHPDTVRKVVQATVRGWQAAAQNPEQAVSYAMQYSDQLNRAHELKMMQASIPLLSIKNEPIGAMDENVWKSMQELLLKQGFMKKAVDVERAFNSEFLR